VLTTHDGATVKDEGPFLFRLKRTPSGWKIDQTN
jgi:hypothetical protein